MAETLELPVVDLSSSDHAATARIIRQACLDHGFFYLTGHGIEKELLDRMFVESKKFFAIPMEERMKLKRNNGDSSGYVPSPMPVSGNVREHFIIERGANSDSLVDVNKWPSEETLPSWRETMKTYYEKIEDLSKNLCSLIAVSLNQDSQFFEKTGAFNPPVGLLHLVHYPGDMDACRNDNYGSSAHSDMGMITLLLTDGVPGLQICKEKDGKPQIWEDVRHLDGAYIVNVGDLLERWTNNLYRSILHRVLALGQERYSVPFFLYPNYTCVVECLDSCCSEEFPARFPPIRSGDYRKEKLRARLST